MTRCISLLLFFVATPAHALTGAEVLTKMDDAMNRYTDLEIDWKVVNQQPGKKEPGLLTFTAIVSGGKALTRFTGPPDLKGTGVLVLGRGQMYIYLPQYGKVRRVASHTTAQGFMGTTFSYDDMNAGKYADVYTADVTSEGDGVVSMTLTAIPDSGAPYARAEMTVDTQMFVPLQMKYFNDKSQHVKTETRSGYECREDVCLGGSHKMEDHTREGAWTELVRVDWTLNAGVPDELFSTRSLQRGE
jgi:outer membrane lipoprotein-sorting protein